MQSIKLRPSSVVPILLCCVINPLCANAENWPTWRGEHGDGISTEAFPTTWNRNENVRWRVDLPEPGNSTPIVWGDRVFVTQPMQDGRRRTLMCFDRETGGLLWQSGVDAVEMEPTHRTNPYCSPSPVTDGERIIAWFGSAGLVAFDFEGKQLWQRPLGSVNHIFGYGQSPVLHDALCLLNFGPGTREFAVAVDKETGEIVWQVDAPRPTAGLPPGGERDIYGTWSTPVVVDEQAVFCFRDSVLSLNPLTGEEIWKCEGLGPQMKASPVAGDGVLVALGGKDSSTLAVRLGGSGDVTQTHVLWKYDHAKSRLGTGVISSGYLYANRRDGIVECIELGTGKVVWQKRHRGAGQSGDTWSSLFLADGKIYAMNQSADVFVIDASPEYKLIATNSLGEHTNATVVGSQGTLLVRTHDALWAIGHSRE
jgi:outer membrane protein assembly factor BamB